MKIRTIHFSSTLPRHRQIEEMLRKLLASKDLVHGQTLPGEVEIARQLRVSRQTVRQAMSTLVSEGLLERRRNAGTRLAKKPLVTQLTDWASFTAEMGKQGVRLTQSKVSAMMMVPPDDVRRFLRTTARQKLLRLVRVRGDESGPIVEFESWIHPRARLKIGEDFSKPLYELIAHSSRLLATSSSEVLGAIVADAKMSKQLGVARGAALLTRLREVRDQHDQPLEWCRCVYRADRFSYAIELRRGKRGES
jgi:GntR family transcriptional regulator